MAENYRKKSKVGKSLNKILDKKIPVNPKYKHIQPTVDTGASLSKYISKIEDIRKNYRYKKDELFKRMKWTTFVQLVLQVAEYNKSKELTVENFDDMCLDMSSRPDTADTADLEVQKIQESSPTVSQGSTDEGDQCLDQSLSADSALYTARSTLQDVIQGVGEVDHYSAPCPEKGSLLAGGEVIEDSNKRPYLLLDVRDKDHFDWGHIITAYSYPSAMLSRTNNSETREMLTYKNQPGKLILMYDYDENICPRVASTIAERGFDNLFLLSGGLKVAEKLFPAGLFVGEACPGPLNRHKAEGPLISHQADFSSRDLEELTICMGLALQDKTIASRLSKATLTSRSYSHLSRQTSPHLTPHPPSSSLSMSGRPRPPFRS